jgi:beta-galactosidase/beta-glucuronidase
VLVRGRIGNLTGKPGTGKLRLRADEAVERGTLAPRPEPVELDLRWDAQGGSFEREIPAPFPNWDEFRPALCHLSAELPDNGAQKTVVFGMREIGTEGTQFRINGRPVFIRGTLECSIFPLTGHPPTGIDAWRKVLHAAKQHGLNSLRFHSHCPPEAAFFAADELGFYLQVETCWANQSTTIGDGKAVDQWVYEETERVLQAYGNHPSFVLMAHGNEPGGRNANAYLAKYAGQESAGHQPRDRPMVRLSEL